jgi:hypothetical protein
MSPGCTRGRAFFVVAARLSSLVDDAMGPDDLLNEKVALDVEGYRIPPRKIYTKDAKAVQQAFKIHTMFSRFTKRARRNCDMKSLSSTTAGLIPRNVPSDLGVRMPCQRSGSVGCFDYM